MEPEPVGGHGVGHRAVEAEDYRVEPLSTNEVRLLIPNEGWPDHLVPGDQLGQMPLLDEDRVGVVARVKVEDSCPVSSLLQKLPQHLHEQLGGEG